MADCPGLLGPHLTPPACKSAAAHLRLVQVGAVAVCGACAASLARACVHPPVCMISVCTASHGPRLLSAETPLPALPHVCCCRASRIALKPAYSLAQRHLFLIQVGGAVLSAGQAPVLVHL